MHPIPLACTIYATGGYFARRNAQLTCAVVGFSADDMGTLDAPDTIPAGSCWAAGSFPLSATTYRGYIRPLFTHQGEKGTFIHEQSPDW